MNIASHQSIAVWYIRVLETLETFRMFSNSKSNNRNIVLIMIKENCKLVNVLSFSQSKIKWHIMTEPIIKNGIKYIYLFNDVNIIKSFC